MKAKKFIDESTFVQERIARLQENYDVDLSTACDATDSGYVGKGWLISYAVLNFTVSIPSPPYVIPDEVYDDAITIFRETHIRLEREKTFYIFRLQPSPRDSASWSLTLFFRNDQLDKKHEGIRQAAELLLRLKLRSEDFQSMYSDPPHLFITFSDRLKQLISFPLPSKMDFTYPIMSSRKLEQNVIMDQYDDELVKMSSIFLGNAFFFEGAYQQAMDHWQVAANLGLAVAFFNIACAFSKLGNMEKAYAYCREAVNQNYSKEEILHDKDFAEFRAHPLFQKIRELL